jgi:single-stranded DNA-binding protein
MYANYANIIVVGTIGKVNVVEDSKTPRINISVAFSKSSKNKDEKNDEKTVWYSTTLFSKSAIEFYKDKLHAGDLVLVRGEPEFRQYTDKNGQPHVEPSINIGFDGTFSVLRYKAKTGGEPS